MMKEEDATVYRRPYLVSGASGFALNAITRAMGKDLKVVRSSITLLLFQKEGDPCPSMQTANLSPCYCFVNLNVLNWLY